MEQSLLFRLKSLDKTAQLIIAILFGILLGAISLLISPILTLGILVGVIVIVLIPNRPEFAILTVIALLSSVVAENLIPIVNFGIFRMYITEPIIIGLFLVILFRWVFDPSYKLTHTPLDLTLTLFLLWAALSTVNGILFINSPIKGAISEGRVLFYYLLFFTITNLILNERSLKILIEGFFMLATLVAVIVIAQYIFGPTAPILATLLSGRIEPLYTEGHVISDVVRITDIVGEATLTVAFITKVVTLFISKPRFRGLVELIQWVLIGTAFIMNFNRAHWLAAILAIVITLFLVRNIDRQRAVAWIFIIFSLLLFILIPFLISPDSALPRFVKATGQRFASIFSEQTLLGPGDVSTLAWRTREYAYAWPQIMSHPVLGLGLGALYRPLDFTIDTPPIKDTRHFIHNGHMWILMKTGFVGYFFLWCFSIIFLWRGFKYWRLIPDSRMRGNFLGFTLSYFALILIAFLHPTFMTLYWASVISMAMGINEVMIKLYVPKKELP